MPMVWNHQASGKCLDCSGGLPWVDPSQPQGREDAIDTSESGNVQTRPARLDGSHSADLLLYLLFP